MRALVLLVVVAVATLVILVPTSRRSAAARRPVAPSATAAPDSVIRVPQDWIAGHSGRWQNLALYGLAAAFIGLTLLPFGLVPALLAAMVIVCHPLGGVVVGRGLVWPLFCFLVLALTLVCLSQRVAGWRVLGMLAGLTLVILSNLAWLPFLLLFLASGLGLRARPARVGLVVVALGMLAAGWLADLPGTIGWTASERLLGGAVSARWAGAVTTFAGLGPALDWIPAGRLPVLPLMALAVVVLAALEESTGRFPRSLVWGGLAASAAAAATATVAARSAAGQAPSAALLLPGVAALGLMCGAAFHTLVESPRPRIRSLCVLPLGLPILWLGIQIVDRDGSGGLTSGVGALDLDPDLTYSRALLAGETGTASPAEVAGLLKTRLLAGSTGRDLPPISRVRVALTCARLYREAGDPRGALAAARMARETAGVELPDRLADRLRAEWLRARWRAGDRDLDQECRQIEADLLAGPESLLAAGQCLLAETRPDGGLGEDSARIEQILLRTLTLDPDQIDALLAMGQLCARTDRLVAAARYLERAHRLAPGDADPAIRLARLYFSQGEEEEGARYLAEALRVTTRPPETSFALGRLLFEATPDKERGVDLMRAALDEQPSLAGGPAVVASCQGQLAALSLTRGDEDTARRLAEGALQLDAKNALAHHTMGRLAMQEGHLEPAVTELGAAYDQAPELPDLAVEYAEAIKALGYQRLLAGKRAEALELFGRVLDLGVAGVETGAIRAIAEGPAVPTGAGEDGKPAVPAVGADSAAAPPSQEGPPRAPSAEEVATARALYEEGVRRLAAGDREVADEKLAASLRILPGNPYALLHRGQIAADSGRREDGLKLWRRAMALAEELEIDLPEVPLRLGLVLAAGTSKEQAEARPLLERFLRDAADDPAAAHAREVLDKLRQEAHRERIPW